MVGCWFLLAVVFEIMALDGSVMAVHMKRAPAIQSNSPTVGTPTDFLATSKVPPAAAKSKAQKSLAVVVEKLQAINETLGQLDVIVNKTNVTVNELIDKVLDGTEKAVDALNMLKMAAQAVGQFGMQAAADAVTNFADRVVVLITDMDDKVTSMREQMQGTVDKHISDGLVLRDQVVGAFAIAMEKVAALENTEGPTLFLQVDEAVWPFDAIFGGRKKNAFDQAEDAIISANKTIVKVADFLSEVNVSSIGLITDLVLGTVQSVVAQFEDRCGAAVTAQGAQLPDVLATQASNVCSAPNSMVSQLSPIVESYEQFLIDNIVIAQDSIQPLFDGISMLMDMVEVAREEEEEVGGHM